MILTAANRMTTNQLTVAVTNHGHNGQHHTRSITLCRQVVCQQLHYNSLGHIDAVFTFLRHIAFKFYFLYFRLGNPTVCILQIGSHCSTLLQNFHSCHEMVFGRCFFSVFLWFQISLVLTALYHDVMWQHRQRRHNKEAGSSWVLLAGISHTFSTDWTYRAFKKFCWN